MLYRHPRKDDRERKKSTTGVGAPGVGELVPWIEQASIANLGARTRDNLERSDGAYGEE
jgi:hypothetical protein